MARRDDDWLRHLHDTHWVPMVQLASLLLGSSASAEDIVVDAFVAANTRRSQFLTEDHAATYLRSAVVNRTRSSHRHRASSEDRVSVAPGQGHADLDEVLRALDVIDSLPQRPREVLVLRYWGGMEEDEVAETLGISRLAVRTHLHRGLRTVRESLGTSHELTVPRVRRALAEQAATIHPGGNLSELLDRVAESQDDERPATRTRSLLMWSTVALLIGLLLPNILPQILGRNGGALVPTGMPSTVQVGTTASGPPSLPTLQRGLPIYYVGSGNLLYREFRDLPTQSDRLTTAIAAVLNVVPLDPALSSLWTGGQVNSATVVGNRIVVDISASAFDGFTSREVALAAINQVVYTAIATVGDRNGEKTVQILRDGSPNLPVLGAPATDFVREGLVPLAPIWILSPDATTRLTDKPFAIEGLQQVSVPSTIVHWQITWPDGTKVVDGQATAAGDSGGWRTWRTMTQLRSGKYVLRVWSDNTPATIRALEVD